MKIAEWAKAHKPEVALSLTGIAVAIYLYEKNKSSSSSSTTTATDGDGALSPGVGDYGPWSEPDTGTSSSTGPAATSTSSTAPGSDPTSSKFESERGFKTRGNSVYIPGVTDEYSTGGQEYAELTGPAQASADEKAGDSLYVQSKKGVFTKVGANRKLDKGTPEFVRK